MVDEIDRAILRHLIRDGRATHRELANSAGLSPNAAGARMARLIERGIISGVHAHIDHAALGRGLEVSMDIWLEHRENDDPFLDLVLVDERIVDVIHITGPVDFRIRAQVGSPEDLQDLLRRLRAEGHVSQTDSRIVMSHAPTSALSSQPR